VTRPQVLRQYAFVGDGERGALVGPEGSVVWLPFPRWHDAPVFDALLGGAAFYEVQPVDPFVWGGHYESGSLVWRNRWVVQGGAVVECRDTLCLPAGVDRAVLLRRIEHVGGDDVDVAVRLCAESALHGGVGGVRFESGSMVVQLGGVWLRCTGMRAPAQEARGVFTSLVRIAKGTSYDLLLELSTSPPRDAVPDAGRLWTDTERAWEQRVPVLSVSVAKRDARHAVAVLNGLTSSDGGMVAAATTSLPERADAGRNYDYRFAWIRDQSYVGEAAAVAGVEHLLDSAVAFVRDRLMADGVQLRPVYRVDGAPAGRQRRVPLPGYPGGSEVYDGNAASDQFQLDCFGEALQLFAVAAERDRLSREVWQAVEIAARGIEERWHEEDYGVWETRTSRWTHSRLVCAAGLARISRYAPPIEASRWSQLSERILGTAAETSLHASGRWQRSPDDPSVDAALLIPQIRGLVPVDDPRSKATLKAVIHDLTEDGLVYRYRQEPGRAEGAFLLCSFWLAIATLQAHDTVGSARWFERARSACGPPALFAEEFDVEQRQLRGNLPQAFVHALLLETASRQSRQPGR
jgi:hypothetical protein